ncbi:hypothetical protein BS50DRAFT_671235 [Corynespora cassiicola Philippines]|uniref:AtmA protein n=1 Tax=Corynespora cassiicola Philippines TaxID=1448308 RepID=A0A2T2PBC3_CORCC|nr:hypothetical protein BS50DRAFT_671235 [Corynespora cassiicola Philippines]
MAQNKALICALLLLAISGADSIMGLAYRNGWLAENASYVEARPRLLPETGIPMRSKFTGIPALDEWLANLLVVFWPVGSGQNPALSTFVVYMAGQCLATHTLVVIEGIRGGNRTRFISYTSLWGMIYQTIPWGVIKPLYGAVHTITSPLARFKTPISPRYLELAAPEGSQAAIVAISMTLGFIVPTVFAALPAPTILTLDQKQILLTVWQGFPLYVGGMQFLLSPFVRKASASSAADRLRLLRPTYRYVLLITSISHLLVIAFATSSALQAHLVPGLIEQITLKHVFVPQSPLSAMAKPFSESCLTLLKYDLYYAAVATLLFSGRMSWIVRNTGTVKVVAECALLSLVFGPGGAALALTWLRDEKLIQVETMKEHEQ